ncbi:MAG: hypothetical protein VKK32_00630, partial [Candidatus Melainabacteria bacterium]|nr:hypothetical protein [Candidatus Melainabacteria bacterium]
IKKNDPAVIMNQPNAGDIGDEVVLSAKPTEVRTSLENKTLSPQEIQANQIQELAEVKDSGKLKTNEPKAIVIAESYVAAQLLPDDERVNNLAETLSGNGLTDTDDSKTLNTFVQSSKILGGLKTAGTEIQENFSTDLDAAVERFRATIDTSTIKTEDTKTVAFTNMSVDRLTIDAGEDIVTELKIDEKYEKARKQILSSKLDQLQGDKASAENERAAKEVRLSAINDVSSDDLTDDISASVAETEVGDGIENQSPSKTINSKSASSKSDALQASAELSGAESSIRALNNQIEGIKAQIS